ncbi:MAG: LON peptidase substrate-binding domain-containing protein [Candidatus Nitronauta litoralis]|uniref:LON peptidase substrate-binding domain-containing protein n=1 Tax=Candidatus Nitronauta litoralis TaxID=2705533 RepID=A0A7T0BWW2_9BACT|nr:MAG: LON peptidase substrate-binding domain-containing protein [Candidatus Nitronauta litoralis]
MTEKRQISLFPLPSTVFYPNTLLPLHIFEMRYREMVAHSIETGQWIGMVLLQSGWEEQYYESPPIDSIGCAGPIKKHTQQEDGKYNIVISGQTRFRVLDEFGDRPFRQANVELLTNIEDSPINKTEGSPFYNLASRFWNFRELLPEEKRGELELDLDNCRSLGDATDRMAHLLDFTLDQQRFFLEELNVEKRVAALLETLELKTRIVQQSSRFAREGLDSRWN